MLPKQLSNGSQMPLQARNIKSLSIKEIIGGSYATRGSTWRESPRFSGSKSDDFTLSTCFDWTSSHFRWIFSSRSRDLGLRPALI